MKAKIKLMASVIILCMVVICAVSLVACETDCSHEWGDWTITKEATCREMGINEHKCTKCDFTEIIEIVALGHDWHDATCTAPKTCSRCAATEGEPIDHTYNQEVVKPEALKTAATCTNAAVYYKSCTCGAVSTNEADTFTSGEPIAHTYDQEVVKPEALKADATCTSAAEYYKSCTCGAISTNEADTFTSGETIDHTYNQEVIKPEALKTAATCTNAAVYYKSCTCGAVSTSDADTFTSGEPIDHTYNQEIVNPEALRTAATCTNAAVYYKSCVCGAIATNGEDIFTSGNPIDHTYNQEVVKPEALKTPATCTSAAVYYKSCTCGSISYGETDTFTSGEPIDHTYDQEEVKIEALKTAATCTNAAVYYKSCVCGEISTSGADTFTSGEPISHTYDKEVVKPETLKIEASCTSAAVYYKSCTCGAISTSDSYTFTSGSANGHSYVEVASTNATCTDSATVTYRCDNCLDEYGESIGDALGHNVTDVTPVERNVAGCEYVLVYSCKACLVDVEGETVYHHTYIASITTPATCTTDGEKTLICACGDTKTEVIAMDTTGHNWVKGTPQDGVRTDNCSICGASKTVTVYEGNTTGTTNANNLLNTEIELNNANISMDEGVINSIGDRNVTISADKFEGADRDNIGLTEDKLAQVGDNPIYNFTINDGTSNIAQFGEENYVTITLPYTLQEGEDVDSIAVWFINDLGELESIKATYNNGFVTFKTNHFSYYTVTRLTPKERCELYGHSYVTHHEEGSCTKDGYDLLVCVRCHESHKENLVIADGHNYSSKTLSATCTENGSVTTTCADCGHSYTTKLNATGHSWIESETKTATCSENGYIKYACTKCSEEYSVTLEKSAHNYTDSVVEATCESDGYTTHVCSNCGDSFNDSYVEALGHSFKVVDCLWAEDNRTATLTLECENDSTHTQELNATVAINVSYGNCPNYVKTTYIAAVSHNGEVYSEQKVEEVGSFEHSFSADWKYDDNQHWKECICGEKSEVTKHTFENEVVTKEPTCTVDGEKTATCECGATKVIAIPATGEHNYEDGVCTMCGKEEPECKHDTLSDWVFDDNQHWKECVCGEKLEVAAHNYANESITRQPTCTVDGEKTVTCVCGASKVMTIPATGEHNYENGTCTMCGKTEAVDCDHKTLHKETINLGELGACESILYCSTCDCGEVKIIDMERSMIYCAPDKEPIPEMSTDENGNMVQTLSFNCAKCGLEVNARAVLKEDGCSQTITAYMTLTFKGNTILENAYYQETYTNHEKGIETTIDLSEYNGCCGGSLVVEKCANCGEILSVLEPKLACNIDINNMTEERVTDDNGIEHTIGTLSCSNCQLKLYTDYCEEVISPCESATYTLGRISYGDTVIVEFYDESRRMEHGDFKQTYEPVGESCEDGIRVIESCSICGYTNTYIHQGGHRTEDFTLNLSEHNACEGTILGSRCVGCGKVLYVELKDGSINCIFEGKPVTDEVVDENGLKHMIITQTCSVCGLKLSMDNWTVEESACITNQYTKICIYVGKDASELLLEYTETQTTDNHQYDETIEIKGESCEDGYVITRKCTICGDTYTTEGFGHRHEHRVRNLDKYGLCGGMIEEVYCSICNTIERTTINEEYCKWENNGVNEEGYTVLTCLVCGATKLELITKTPKDEECYVRIDTTFIYLKEGKEVFKIQFPTNTWEHSLRHEFTLKGESCDEGYTVLITCADCNLREESNGMHHNMFVVYTLRDDHPHCNNHKLSISRCPCGERVEVEFDRSSFTYDEATHIYSCESCALTIFDNVERLEEGCIVNEKRAISVKWENEELYGLNIEKHLDNHNFNNVTMTNNNGVKFVTSICDKCNQQIESEIKEAVMENHDGLYYYDYTFTPTETATYTIMGLSDRDTRVYLYEIMKGQMVEITSNDDSGYNDQFKLSVVLGAGKTYVYRICFYNQDSEGTIGFIFSTSTSINSCRHENLVAYAELIEGATTCEDGAFYGHICAQCGNVTSCTMTNAHQVIEIERIYLSEYGACYGELTYVACACRAESDFSFDSCYQYITNNEYNDDQGRLVHEEVRSCQNCGLRSTISYYTIEDKANCRRTKHYTIIINVGTTLVAERHFAITEPAHEYEITTKLAEGSTTCEDGVEMTSTCKTCGKVECNTYYHHETFESNRINHSDYGSVCGGYTVVMRCACGKNVDINLDEGCLCDLRSKPCDVWIDNAISGDNFTIDGNYYYNNYAYIYTCAVTDPTACAYQIRTAEYWVKVPGECLVEHCQVWQFGYNEETNEYKYQLGPYVTERSPYHNYTNSTTDNRLKFDCPDCGSYYYENNYYDANGNRTKYEKKISNTIDNGSNKYYELIEEYTIVDNNENLSRSYEKIINSYNETRVVECLITNYEGPFGEGGRKEVSNVSDFNGEITTEENAYVYYKNNEFQVYSYVKQGDYWMRNDFTYSFEGGCTVTTVFTNSDGENKSHTERCCKFGYTTTIKEPTCTQEGIRCRTCMVCGLTENNEILFPLDHAWVNGDNEMHFCSRCGLENLNGASGSIIMEDLTEKQGNGENYVVGYYMATQVEFTKYVSLVLADGSDIILDSVEFTTIDGITAFAFSKAAIETYATENGYTDYLVKFTFVPYGADCSFDYAITFAEATQETSAIVGSVAFVDYVGEKEQKTYTITPTENMTWTLTSISNGDPAAILSDNTGAVLADDDDGGGNREFMIVYELMAGQTYTLTVRWINSEYSGYVGLIFDCTPVAIEEGK